MIAKVRRVDLVQHLTNFLYATTRFGGNCQIVFGMDAFESEMSNIAQNKM